MAIKMGRGEEGREMARQDLFVNTCGIDNVTAGGIGLILRWLPPSTGRETEPVDVADSSLDLVW